LIEREGAEELIVSANAPHHGAAGDDIVFIFR